MLDKNKKEIQVGDIITIDLEKAIFRVIKIQERTVVVKPIYHNKREMTASPSTIPQSSNLLLLPDRVTVVDHIKDYDRRSFKVEDILLYDLRGIEFENTVFSQIDFSGINMNDITFTNCSLDHCCFDDCHIHLCAFKWTTLNHCSFDHTSFTRSIFSKSMVSLGNFVDANIKELGVSCTTFSNTIFDGVSISDSDFGDVVFTSNSMLLRTTITDTDFDQSVFTVVIMRNIKVVGCNFKMCDILNIELRSSELEHCCFSRCSINRVLNPFRSGMSCRECYFNMSTLRDVDICRITGYCNHIDPFTIGYYSTCPEEGSFVAWKKCRNGKIVKLLVPEDAKRSSAGGTKCRCSKAIVLDIEDRDGKLVSEAVSMYDRSFIYKKGETVEAPNFDEDHWNECSSGIHFFISKEQAIKYNLV